MPVNKLFGGTVELAHQALNLRLERQNLISANIANMNTPGYTVQEFSFADALKSAVAGVGRLTRTDPRHLDVPPSQSVAAVRDERRPVDLDEEMLKLSENALFYQVTARIVSKKLAGMRYVIDEAGK